MSLIAPVLAHYSRKIASLTKVFGRRVRVETLGVTDRVGHLELRPPGGLVSPNGACRMFRVADGWMALNLARDEDRDLVPAWLGCDFGGDPWDLIAAHALTRTTAELRDRADLLGLPAAVVGEVTWGDPEPLRIRERHYERAHARATPRVVDLSALWAGPMCGAILAAMGAEVTKVESVHRPDPTRLSTPAFFRNLNGLKTHLALDLKDPDGKAQLRAMVLDADIVITSARPRGLTSIGLDPEAIMTTRPGLTWVAITGYGLTPGLWENPWANRVAFGDDAAAAGGLVGWTRDREPRFLGDALSDPVTGLAAAVGALRGLEHGGGVVVDAGMAVCAARAAIMIGEGLSV